MVRAPSLLEIAPPGHQSNLIGEDHDLAALGQRASERRDQFDDDAAVGDLAKLKERRPPRL